MDFIKGRKHSSIQMVLESLLHLSVIPLSLALLARVLIMTSETFEINVDANAMAELASFAHPGDGKWLAVLLFLILAIIRLLQAFRSRENGKAFFIVSLVQAGGLLVGAALPLIIGFTLDTLFSINMLYAVVMAIGRIYAIVRNHKVFSVLLNVVCIIILLLSILTIIGIDMLIFFLAVLSLMKIIFAPISMTTLRRIIRKTYAAEIIFGLFLLIVTFSFLLYYFEPGIGSIKDALWYCFAIVTTIGFGDLTAVTDFGRILSVILGAYGIVVVALITSIIVNFYGEMKKDSDGTEEGELHGT